MATARANGIERRIDYLEWLGKGLALKTNVNGSEAKSRTAYGQKIKSVKKVGQLSHPSLASPRVVRVNIPRQSRGL